MEELGGEKAQEAGSCATFDEEKTEKNGCRKAHEPKQDPVHAAALILKSALIVKWALGLIGHGGAISGRSRHASPREWTGEDAGEGPEAEFPANHACARGKNYRKRLMQSARSGDGLDRNRHSGHADNTFGCLGDGGDDLVRP